MRVVPMRFVVHAIVACLMVLAGTAPAPARAGAGVAEPPRPNILWITAEDMSPDLGCYGETYARTPNLDRLAGQGARFSRAFATAPVCAPSRSSIITGMYASSIGTHHHRSNVAPPPHVKCFPEYLRAAGYYCTNNAKTDYNFPVPPAAWDENGPQAHWRNRPAGKPFFAVFNLMGSHESRVQSPEKFPNATRELQPSDYHDPASATLPPYYPDTPAVRNDWARYHDLVTVVDYQVADLLRQLEEDGLAEQTIVMFFSDHGRGLPRGKRWLYDSGLRVPLIVRWPGRIPAGTVRDELVSLVDMAPTMLSLAAVSVPPHLQGQVFLGDGAGAPRQHVYGTRDRMDETHDMIRCVRDARYKYIRNFRPELPYAQPIKYMDRMRLMQEWRRVHAEGALEKTGALFFQPTKPAEELYDCELDPHEVHNLASDPSHEARLRAMRAEMDRWMAEIGDKGHLPEAQTPAPARAASPRGSGAATTPAATDAP